MTRRGRWLIAAMLGGLGWLAAACSVAPSPRPLLVAAAVSLADPLQEVAGAEPPSPRAGPSVQFHFASSGALQQQILQGAPVDVFLSAGKRQLDALESAGRLLPGSRRELFSNELVLVVPSRSSRRTLSFEGLAQPELRSIAIGDPSVPAGDYARQVLASMGLSAVVAPKLVPLGSVRAVAQAVAEGHVDAGFVYRTDAQAVEGLRITAVALAGSHDPIRYAGAVLKTSRDPAAAEAYLRSLAESAAREPFRRHGFRVPGPSSQP
ncbi:MULTISPECIES: molybdate ABC transporter substrate-binding protein [unclassified Synechococcus]|uniref:molybdate ABC transporter substrate-binding protein n=1 Tax=unclassified Synechococcus TaxID=2626047 RepID=UPI0005637AD0|nr:MULTISPECIES: molybdate ABC transporter substrate-binding protein [unclassified Synechococcus]WFN59764.1 molybdate ABC transporter substrate-binding protein [Synechococcus sp. CCFWC 502]